MIKINNLDEKIREAVYHFWLTRDEQLKKQKTSIKQDYGARSAVTGGKQMAGFERLAAKIALDAGIPESSIFCTSRLELPGYFRPEKKWDLLIVDQGTLVAAVEFKSQVGPSFGNNFNNRAEEAIGTAQDLWIAYREGVFGEQQQPWLGYLFILEDCDKTQVPVTAKQPHFKVSPDFMNASYAKRYEILLTKLVRERYYTSACLIISKKPQNIDDINYSEPREILRSQVFFTTFAAHLEAYVRLKNN